MYYGVRGAIAYVLQWGATTEAAMPAVLNSLQCDAWRMGLCGIEARICASEVPVVSQAGGLILHRLPYVLAHTARPDLLQLLDRGNVFLSRLEGDWWTRLIGDRFDSKSTTTSAPHLDDEHSAEPTGAR
jgi:hypothetical protein